MKAVRVSSFGGPEVLEFASDVPVPVPSSSQVLISIKAVGLNPVDTIIRAGAFPIKPDLPYTPGSDCAGVIEAVGSNVKKFRVGDRVWTYRSVTGTCAEYALGKEAGVYHLPDELSFEQGASLGVPYMTAYRALVSKGCVKIGETVLVHGASGGVGIAGVQLAKGLGCKVIGTAGTGKGMEIAKEAGADHVFNHREADYIQEIMKVVPEVDLILEMAAHVNLLADLSMLSQGGRVIVIGAGGFAQVNPMDLLMKEVCVTGMTISAATTEDGATAAERLYEGAKLGWVRPIVGNIFGLSQTVEAHEAVVASKGAVGRTILVLD